MRIVSFFQIPPSVKYDPARPGFLARGPPPPPSPGHSERGPPPPPPILLPPPPPPSSLSSSSLLLEQDLNVSSSSSSSSSGSSGSSSSSSSSSSGSSNCSNTPDKKRRVGEPRTSLAVSSGKNVGQFSDKENRRQAILISPRKTDPCVRKRTRPARPPVSAKRPAIPKI